MRTVMKFGGSILSNEEDLRRVAELVKQRREQGEELCMVVSALKGMTDALIDSSEKALKEEKFIEGFLTEVKERHFTLIEKIKDNELKNATMEKIGEKTDVLERALYGITYLGELSERSKALIYTTGERLSAVLVEGYLKEAGVKAVSMDAREAGIVTDDCFSETNPIMDKTQEMVGKKVAPMLKEQVVVITGYLGANEEGAITCFGRGGSDFSAGILANVLDANTLELWKDVDGFMSADPKAVKDAKFLEQVSYDEAEELGFFGAKILHPRTVVPLRPKGIKAIVKNILKPEEQGTVISGEKRQHNEIVKSIACRKNIGIIYLKSPKMVSAPGALAQIFGAMSNARISVDLVATSEAGVSFTIKEEDMKKAKKALEKCGIGFEEMRLEKDVAMIGVIGEGLKGKTEVAGRIFSTLGKAGISSELISQGSSEINISFVVKEGQLEKAVQQIHSEFH